MLRFGDLHIEGQASRGCYEPVSHLKGFPSYALFPPRRQRNGSMLPWWWTTFSLESLCWYVSSGHWLCLQVGSLSYISKDEQKVETTSAPAPTSAGKEEVFLILSHLPNTQCSTCPINSSGLCLQAVALKSFPFASLSAPWVFLKSEPFVVNKSEPSKKRVHF